MHRYPQLIITGLALLAGALIAAPSAPGARAATQGVTVADYSFTDGTSGTSTTTITAGDTVTWTWSGASPHSVTADDSSFDEPPGSSKTSGTFSRQFNTPGTFAYYCRIHGAPGGQGMSGTVVVQAAAATNTPTSTATTTNTPAATNTPGSPTATAEGTNTPTSTPASSVTTVAATATPAVTRPAAAVPSSGGTGGAAQLPRSGSGRVAGAPSPWPSIILAAAGAASLAGAMVLRRSHARR